MRGVIDRFFSDSAVQHYAGSHGSDRRGKLEIYQTLSALLRALSGLRFDVLLSATNADGTGIVHMRASGVQTGPLLSLIPATGQAVAVPLYEVARLDAHGKFVEMWSSLDKFMMLDQCGVFQQLKKAFPTLAVS